MKSGKNFTCSCLCIFIEKYYFFKRKLYETNITITSDANVIFYFCQVFPMKNSTKHFEIQALFKSSVRRSVDKRALVFTYLYQV